MPPTLMHMLTLLSGLAKENQSGPIRCRVCYRSVGLDRHGYYERYLFGTDEKIKIQRYLCRNPDCTCLTFSILPHPFLRYIRLPLCFLFLLLESYESKTGNLSSLARDAGLSRPVIKRAIGLARRLENWLLEVGLWPSGSRPCLDPKGRWTDFNRALSWAFYPARYGRLVSHTT